MASVVNRILLYLLLVGVGALAGLGAFHVLYETSCTELLTAKNSRENASLGTLQENYSKATSDHKRCLQDMVAKEDSQATLAGKHQDLLQKHEATLEKLNEVQRASDASSQTVSTLQEQIKRLQRELGQSTVQVQLSKQTAYKEVQTLKEQLNLSRTMLREKQDAIDRRQPETGVSSRGGSSGDTDRYRQELNVIMTAIRRYSLAQCLLKYGEGPYTIQFTLDLPSPPEESSSTDQNQNQSMIDVEFRLIPELAYTIFTILNLAELGLYTGTTLRNANDSTSSVFGGRPKDAAAKNVQARLQRRYAETGHGAEPFILEELSPRAPCHEYTFGIAGRGPGFVIPLVPQHQDGSLSCPGRVVRGKETLNRLNSLPKRDRVTIVSVDIIMASSSSASSSSPKEEL
jgi:vacuolar-type H+-ATPase subunit E/Vma4